jgi:hypothetical protein
VPDQRKFEVAFLVPADDKAIFVACVYLVIVKTEAANELVVLLPLESPWRIEHMLRRIVNDIHLIIFVLKQLVLSWSFHINPLPQLLLFQVPYYTQA